MRPPGSFSLSHCKDEEHPELEVQLQAWGSVTWLSRDHALARDLAIPR